ncbi:MAG: hypothetical protein WBD86_01345 [Microgenomates group bacterium]
MRNKTVFILTLSVFLLVGVLWTLKFISIKSRGVQEVETDVEKTKVGGDKDEHGCIGSAGYRFDEEIEACIRDWELDENQKRAAKMGVEATGLENSTVIEVLATQCSGCFTITLEAGKNRLKVTIQDWLVVEQSMTPEECIGQGGRTVNITGGFGCETGEEEIGEVTGFISPNICCKAISE